MGKYFGTDGIRGRVGEGHIHPEFMLKLAWAAGKVLAQDKGARVIIGKDTRISGYMLEAVLEAGLVAAGVDVLMLGPMPTPAIAYLTKTFRASAGIVISASHNPYDDNGIKFFSHDGYKLSLAMEAAIEAKMDEPMVCVDSENLGRAKRMKDAPGRYIEFCKSTFPNQLTLSGLKIALDCANGATYHVAGAILEELGADVVTMGASPDGMNINKNCGAVATEELQKLVLSSKADVGIALDGDGDRLMMVDHTGALIDGDQLLAILAKDRLHEAHDTGVVGTLMTNLGLELMLKDLGLGFVRADVGDRFVMEELKRSGWHLGGESSGHLVDLSLTTTGDGMISALQILRVIQTHSRNLADLKTCMTKCPQVLINVRVEKPQTQVNKPKIRAAVKSVEQNMAGRGRVLLRASGTEPKIRVMVEGEDAKEVQLCAEALAEEVRAAVLTV
jgi:phosphoglucosamine mutase